MTLTMGRVRRLWFSDVEKRWASCLTDLNEEMVVPVGDDVNLGDKVEIEVKAVKG